MAKEAPFFVNVRELTSRKKGLQGYRNNCTKGTKTTRESRKNESNTENIFSKPNGNRNFFCIIKHCWKIPFKSRHCII